MSQRRTFAVAIIVWALGSVAVANAAQGTRIDEVPMYGGMDRAQNLELKTGDEKFITEVTAQFGTREKASAKWVDQGFAFYRQDNLAMAMRRFNQAWLLNPSNPDVYWGFASVLYDQEKYCEAKTMTDKAFATGALQDGFLPDAAINYVGCATQDRSLSVDARDAMLKRSDALFDQAYSSPAVRKEYTLFHWARAMYARGEYAMAWTKVADYRRVTGKEFPSDFTRSLSRKMREPK